MQALALTCLALTVTLALVTPGQDLLFYEVQGELAKVGLQGATQGTFSIAWKDNHGEDY